jgi:hypothetical protein
VAKDEQNGQIVRILYLRNRTEPHRENLKEDYDRVAKRALEEKKQVPLKNGSGIIFQPILFLSINNSLPAAAWLNGAKQQKFCTGEEIINNQHYL